MGSGNRMASSRNGMGQVVMSDTGEQVIELDVRGQICPSCLLATLQVLNEQKDALKRGALSLRVRTDSRDATSTIPEAVGNMGYAVRVEKADGHYLISVRRRPRDIIA